jgi:hypothetical protein
MEPQVTDGFRVPRGCGSIVREQWVRVVQAWACGPYLLLVHRYSPCSSTVWSPETTGSGGTPQVCLACCLIRMVSSLTVL